nr:coproporphyrinogen III oxidase [Paraflavitalea speifideiaquila]
MRLTDLFWPSYNFIYHEHRTDIKSPIKENWINYIHDLQNRICKAVEQADGQAAFKEDKWDRPEGGGGKPGLLQVVTFLKKAALIPPLYMDR